MAKFSGSTAARASGTSELRTRDSGRTALNHEGAVGLLPSRKTELFLLAVSNMVGADTFYEDADIRDARYRDALADVSRRDPAWVAGLVHYLRRTVHLRSAAVVAAVEYALADRPAGAPSVRSVVDSALDRGDEPAELIGYWIARTGSNRLPAGVKRGLSDAVARLYTERAALRYDGDSRSVRMGDVVRLVHPTARTETVERGGERVEVSSPKQNALFRYLMSERRRGGDARFDRELLPTIAAYRDLLEVPVGDRRSVSVDRLAAAAMDFERLSGWLQGPMDADAWESVIPQMGYMALLRNLRNFDEARISRDAVQFVSDKLSDPTEVAKSRQMPFRFLSAYKEAPGIHWGPVLEAALDASLANVPTLPGVSLVVVDTSGSMVGATISPRSRVTAAEQAAVFGLALAKRSEGVELVQFASDSQRFTFRKGGSVLGQIEEWKRTAGAVGHGTVLAPAIRRHYRPDHGRVVVLSDDQAFADVVGVDRSVPGSTPLHRFNLSGYRVHSAPSGSRNRYVYGGMTDSMFSLIPLLERGGRASWPWEDRG